MPVDVKTKLRAVVDDLGSQARVAELLGVSRSRVSRWLRTGEEPDERNRRKLQEIEFVLAQVLDLYRRDTALRWLEGSNPHAGWWRPVDLIREGRYREVLEAIDAERGLAYA